MESLAGWCVAITADRRAQEQAQLLEACGARVLSTRLVTSSPCGEGELRACTAELVADPPDTVVANTAVGVRGWIAWAASWGLGDALLSTLRQATVVARGAKAAAALHTEDVAVAWRSTTETLDDVADRLISSGVAGTRIAVQLDGRLDRELGGRLRGEGAEVIDVPVYRVEPDPGGAGARRLCSALHSGELDAVTFTSPAAVDAYAALNIDADVLHACVGPVTAAAAAKRHVPAVLVPRSGRGRLGPMVRTLAVALSARARTIRLGEHTVQVQGSNITVDDQDERVQLTPTERTLLDALIDARGAVLSKPALAGAAWSGDVDDHAVEVAVNRLRRKLGPAAPALETTNRRGYRLAASEET